MRLVTILILLTPWALPAQWKNLSSTTLTSLCPVTCSGSAPPSYCAGISYDYQRCKYVVDAWGTAAVDTVHNRVIIWGGGHTDYSGNELYLLDLSGVPVLTRINDPSIFTLNVETNVDGTPTSRHPYGGLVYLPQANKMFMWGNGIATAPIATKATWLLDLSNVTYPVSPSAWTRGSDNLTFGESLCVLEPRLDGVEAVLCGNFRDWSFDRYVPETDIWTRLADSIAYFPYQSSIAADTRRRKLWIAGTELFGPATSGVYTVDLTGSPTYVPVDVTGSLTGCSAMYSANYPGLDYDSDLDRIVGYPNTGNSVILLDPATGICSTVTNTGGPTKDSSSTGTQGRWAYLPSIRKHVAIVNPTANMYTLSLPSAATKFLITQ